MIKDAGENGPRSETSAILKEQHQNFAKRFIDKWIAKYVFFIINTTAKANDTTDILQTFR